ncbi:hypothetical protein PIB30_037589 [Stylosanthes scabra]|uniref:Uncharacterized protein n=1 Tax=Stylosanthes scabra TaxID=79078 RepID=A0ABU6WEZ4_9FABA|nr:hypothetical protein [Stylosanthes scabra]
MRPPPSSEFCVGLHLPTTTLLASSTPLIGSCVNEDYYSSMGEGVAAGAMVEGFGKWGLWMIQFVCLDI